MATDLFYPTASTVAVFLNGIHVDQAYRLDYKESIPKTPVYGYNDYEFTKVVRGKGIIQGMLINNFTVPFYLNAILDSKKDAYVPRLYNYDLVASSISRDQSFERTVTEQWRSELPANVSETSKAARAEYIASILGKHNKNKKDQIKMTLYDFFDQEVKHDEQIDRAGRPISVIPSPLVISPSSEQGNTLDVYYHDPEYITWFMRFNQIEFFDISQQISQAGADGSSEPLYEIAQFIARNKEIKLIG